MKKAKKLLFTLVSTVMAIASFASCGGTGATSTDGGNSTPNSTPNTPTNYVAYDGSKVTIKFYHTMGANLRAVLDKYIPAFNAMYPNITVKAENAGSKYEDLRDQISTEITAGNSPHIAYCYPDHVALYKKANKVITLDEYIESEEVVTKKDGTTEIMGFTQAQLDDFVDAYYNEGMAFGDGKMYTLPYAKSTEVLFYNKTEFEKNKWTVPTTWDEMEDLCEVIREKYPNDVPFGYDSEANWFITMCEQYGSAYTSTTKGEYFLYNNEVNRGFVSKFMDWFEKGYFETQETYGSYTSDLFTQQTGPKAFMCIGSTGGTSYQKAPLKEGSGDEYAFEVGIAMIPQVNPAQPKVISQGPSLCLFKKPAQEQAAAWLFTKFLTTHVPLQAEFSMTNGYAPVIESVEQNPVYKQFLDSANTTSFLAASSVKQSVLQKGAYFVSPAFEASSAARDEVGLLMQNCFVNNANVEKAFADSVKKLRDKYEK